MDFDKKNIRKIYLQKRLALSEGEYPLLCHKLCDSFFANFDLSFIKVVHIFLPIEEKREPDTWLIVDRIRREFPHIRLSIPKINVLSNEMENFYFEGLHQIEKSNWGISEPKQGIPTPTEKIDMILVPLLAFDSRGNRVGYGKGFYDKFLSSCRADCKKIGLSFFENTRITDKHQSDVPLNFCITPKTIFEF